MTPKQLLAAIRAHPHFSVVLAQFREDMRDGLECEAYEGESRERSEIWALLYELLASEPPVESVYPALMSKVGEDEE
jgi:hypothetical protein